MMIRQRTVTRSELVAICGDMTNAIILGQLLYWTDKTHDFAKYLVEETDGDGLKDHGWIYKSAEDMRAEIMTSEKRWNVGKRLRDLVELGFIDARHNPINKWDRTLQYRVNARAIVTALAQLGDEYHQALVDDFAWLANVKEFETLSIGENVQSIGDTHHSIGDTHQAIPETITETTEEEEERAVLCEKRASTNERASTPQHKLTWNDLYAEFGRDVVERAVNAAPPDKKNNKHYILAILQDWRNDPPPTAQPQRADKITPAVHAEEKPARRERVVVRAIPNGIV